MIFFYFLPKIVLICVDLFYLQTTFSMRDLINRCPLLRRIKEDLAHGRSCHARMLFLKMCEMAVVLFSRSYFKTTFFHQFLALYQASISVFFSPNKHFI